MLLTDRLTDNTEFIGPFPAKGGGPETAQCPPLIHTNLKRIVTSQIGIKLTNPEKNEIRESGFVP